jgi:hypothetical protein
MTLLCAPVRDEAVQKLENITDPIRLLRGIFQVLGLMKMDMVNYTIQSLQPQPQEHSIQYERAVFQEQLNKQPGMCDVRAGMGRCDLAPVFLREYSFSLGICNFLFRVGNLMVVLA